VSDIDRLPSGRYQARTRVDGRQVKKSFDKIGDARDWLARKRTEQQSGQQIDDRAGRTPLADYAATYVKDRPYRSSTASNRRVQVAAIKADPIGTMPLHKVRPSHVQAFATRYAQTHARSTTASLVGFLRSVFRQAVEDRCIGVSPVGRVTLPTPDAVPVVPLTVARVRAIAEALPTPLDVAAVVQAASGLRCGELLGLRVADLDMLRREVHVREQLHPRDRVRVPLKTPWSRRVVPLPDVARDALAAHLAEHPSGSWVFTDEQARPLQHGRYAKALQRHGVTSHDFRHHYASVLLEAGESVVAVARRLGHKDATLVLSVYGHLLPDSEERTRRAIDSAWCAPGVPLAADTGT